jgi:hypothetical protein
MVREHVEKTMKKALKRFAGDANTTPNNIAFFIHTKPNEADPSLSPKYFYSIEGRTVTDENGKLKDLRFTQDILDKKFDLLGTEALAKNFLQSYFKTFCTEMEIDPKSLYIMITTSDEEAKKLKLAAYKGSEVVRELELEEIFGE